MSTQPGFAFVTGASRGLGRNTALDLADPPHERGDAARNRALLLDAARRLIAARDPDTVTMDEIAAAAGVGKGTLFRRFGSRAGVMIVLLDEDEQAEHYPPPTAQRHRPRSAVSVQTRRSRCTAPTLGQLRSDRAAWAASVRRLRCCGS